MHGWAELSGPRMTTKLDHLLQNEYSKISKSMVGLFVYKNDYLLFPSGIDRHMNCVFNCHGKVIEK